MPEFGFMGVDWEERINFARMRRERLQKAKDALAKSDLDYLFVCRPEDVRYLTGFRHHMRPVPAPLGSCTVVLPRGGDPILFTIDHRQAKIRQPWMHDMIFPPVNVRSPIAGIKTWAERLAAIFGKEVEGKVGLDVMTFDMWQPLQDSFPKVQFVDGYKVLMQAKIIKTEDELECLRAACMITEAGMDAALRILKPGVRECEVLAEAWRVFTALGSEWTQCANIVASGPNLAPYRRHTSDRIIREGDLVALDIGACFNG